MAVGTSEENWKDWTVVGDELCALLARVVNEKQLTLPLEIIEYGQNSDAPLMHLHLELGGPLGSRLRPGHLNPDMCDAMPTIPWPLRVVLTDTLGTVGELVLPQPSL